MDQGGHSRWKRWFAEPGNRLLLWLIVTTLIWVLAIGAGWKTFQVWRRWDRQRPVREADLAQLLQLEQTVAGWRKAVGLAEQRCRGGFQPFEYEKTPLFREGALMLVRNETDNVLTGWRVRRLRFEGSDVPLAGLSDFLTSAESAIPPWRLASLTIDALDARPGRGRVVLELETVEKETP
jgi:hypothetical protein